MTDRMTEEEIDALCERLLATDESTAYAFPHSHERDCRAAVTAIRQLQNPWMPIETAPRDGTRVLLALAGEWTGEGYFSGHDDTWREPNNHPTDTWGSPLTPTHWRHLPPAPETSA